MLFRSLGGKVDEPATAVRYGWLLGQAGRKAEARAVIEPACAQVTGEVADFCKQLKERLK